MSHTVRRNDTAALRAQGRACRRSCVGLLLTPMTELLLLAVARFLHPSGHRFSRAHFPQVAVGSPVKQRKEQHQKQGQTGAVAAGVLENKCEMDSQYEATIATFRWYFSGVES